MQLEVNLASSSRLSSGSPQHTGIPGCLYLFIAAGEEMIFWSYFGSKVYLKDMIIAVKNSANNTHSNLPFPFLFQFARVITEIMLSLQRVTQNIFSLIQWKKFQSNLLLARCQKISKCWLKFLLTLLIKNSIMVPAGVLSTCHAFYSLPLFFEKSYFKMYPYNSVTPCIFCEVYSYKLNSNFRAFHIDLRK